MALEDRPRKVFTVPQANAALPAVAARVERLRFLRDEIRRCRELLDVLWQRLDAGESVLSAIGEQQRAIDGAGDEFGRLVLEVEALGAVLRDLDPGLVDFPAEVRGIPIYLCWRAGEARITFWHGLGEGFAGRKPILGIDDLTGSRPN